MRHFKWLVIALLVATGASAQTINCPAGFSSSGACGTGNPANFEFFANGGANLSGSEIIIQPTGVVHNPSNVDYQTPVNVQAFAANFSFVPNAWNLAFYLTNSTHNAGSGVAPGHTMASSFNGGAGCEEGFYQAFGGPGNYPANNIFVLNFDSANYLVNNASPFYSNVQIYQQLQSPCIPDDGQPWYYPSNKVSTSPVSMNSPATTPITTTGDTYNATIIYTGTAVTLNFYDATTHGTCSPATSPSCFTYTWPNVSIPSLVDGTTAYLGFGGSSNASTPGPLILDSLVYTVLSAAATPTFSPAAGTYSSAQSVTISGSSGSTICYNTTGSPYTDGNGNCPNGTKYTGAVSVAKGETLYASAGSGATAYGDSTVGSAAYNIAGSGSTPTFNQPAGTYQGNQTVYLTSAHGSVICYNTTGSPATNGTTGCASGTVYSGPITVSSNTTLYAVAGGTGYTDSAVGSAAYVISPFAVVDGYTGSYPANSPKFSVAPGNYSGTQTVSLSTTTPGANICFITSSTAPTLLPEPDSLGGCSVGTPYTGAISVPTTTTIYAAAGTTVGANVPGTGPPSSVVSATYIINPLTGSAPSFSPAAGTYASAQTVTISDASPGTTIYYTANGMTPTTSSTPYTVPITVGSTETLQAIAVATGGNSAVTSAAYTITSSSSLPVVVTPTFSPAPSAYITAQSVTISDATSDATIYYTTNGTVPGPSSAEYTGPITVSSTETLEAIAAATGYTDSAVAPAAYTIAPTAPSVSMPTFSPGSGTYVSSQSVTISDATSGATIYYMTDGTTPTTSSTKYTGPITVTSTETLEAVAVATGDSAVASAVYTINSQPNFVLGTSTAALSVSSGGQGTVTLTVTPINGFDSPVILACSALPAWATCSFNQATVTPSNGAVTTQLTVSTTAQSSAMQAGPRTSLPLRALAMTVCLFGWRRRRGWKQWLLLAMVCTTLGLFSGCGVSGVTDGTSTTPKSSVSTVTVTAVSGTLQGTATFTLTVS